MVAVELVRARSTEGAPLAQEAPARAPPKRRKRTVISCGECHRRKQKCDRGLPCSNCKFRNKESACRYESPTSSSKASSQQSSQQSQPPARKVAGEFAENQSPPSASASASATTQNTSSAHSRSPLDDATWSLTNTHLTTGNRSFYQSLDSPAAENESLSTSATSSTEQSAQLRMNETYKDLIRQLPPRVYIEKLLEVYFRDLNWQYYIIDEADFSQLLREWYRVPYHVFARAGPTSLHLELRAFPGLLFQVLASVLLILPDDDNGPFSTLKYVGTMPLRDLAIDYSESGARLVKLLGKPNICLSTIQAGLIRAMCLKYVANITGSWKTIHATAADAQDIGLHDDRLDPKPLSTDFKDVFENQWLIQRRRILYMTLMSWDIHYALLLGKPAYIDWHKHRPSLPVDAPIPKDKSTTPVRPRDEVTDPPTALTRSIWMCQLVSPLRRVRELEALGQCPESFAEVDAVHRCVLTLVENLPPYLRLENSDWRWDSHPDCSWLISTRFYLAQLAQFSCMVLHRPYIFHRPESRTEALKAAMDMLLNQKLTFQGTEANSWKNIFLFFGSLDAIVLIALVYIFFPNENTALLHDAAQNFEWTTARFEAMQPVIPLAKPAKGIAEAMYKRMLKSVAASHGPADPLSIASICASSPSEGRSLLPTGYLAPTPAQTSRQQNGVRSPGDLLQLPVNGTPLAMERAEAEAAGSPPLAPLYPMTDIIYHSLHVPDIVEPQANKPSWTWGTRQDVESTEYDQDWKFRGEFSKDSLWNFLNELP